MRWFGKRRGKDGGKGKGRDHRSGTLETSSRKPRKGFLALAAVALLAAAVVTVPQSALADGHEEGEGWSSDEIEFRPPQPVEGRRAGGELAALLGLGNAGRGGEHRLLAAPPRSGAVPHLLMGGRAGAGRSRHLRGRADPVPAVEGELCNVRLASLGWTPGAVSGVVESECVTRIEHPVDLKTVAGHASVTETALMEAQVTAIEGAVSASTGESQATASFVPNGETRFRLPVEAGEAVHPVTIDVGLEATLRIPIPPLTQLTHHPERVQQVTRTVHLHRPGDSDSDSETATVTCEDGATSSATATAYAYVPSATIAREVTVEVLHPEHVKSETVERSPIAGSRDETLALASGVGADAPFSALVLPQPEPEPERGEQSPAGGGLSAWFDLLGWEWPW